MCGQANSRAAGATSLGSSLLAHVAGTTRRPGTVSTRAQRPPLRPVLEGRERVEQAPSLRARRVAVRPELDDPRIAQLPQALHEDARGHTVAALAERAEVEWPVAHLPEDADRPAPPEQVEQRHDRPSGARAAHGPSRRRYGHGNPLRYVFRSRTSCFGKHSTCREGP